MVSRLNLTPEHFFLILRELGDAGLAELEVNGITMSGVRTLATVAGVTR